MAVLLRRNSKGSEKYLRLYIREQKEEVGKRSGSMDGILSGIQLEGVNKGQKASLRLSDRRAGVGNTKQVPFADWKHVPVLGAGAVCQLIKAVSGGVISRLVKDMAHSVTSLTGSVSLWDFKNLSVFEKSTTLYEKNQELP
ncbi:hypothetical protein EAG_00717 [Camponotus floridanus]|uniref:Uncharacterized protein n=1 Tax=Camponotus floridanus TaxID=104421 RepID=E2AU65_CAMFO|nr:hypothetical protein EAG_00717 [Camponotus floridanus]